MINAKWIHCQRSGEAGSIRAGFIICLISLWFFTPEISLGAEPSPGGELLVPVPAVQLTTNMAADSDPTWNPTRPDTLAFFSDRGGQYQVWLVTDLAGTPVVVPVSGTEGAGGKPAWSADGDWLLFSKLAGAARQIFKIRPDGSGVTQLTFEADFPHDCFPDAWSTQNRIALSADLAEMGSNIWILDAGDLSLVQLTNGSEVEGQVDWSPDGAEMLFRRSNPATTSQYIWKMNSDGSDQIQLSELCLFTEDEDPAWSPDGAAIVFTRGIGGDEIYLMDAAGEPPSATPLTDSPGVANKKPCWSPDGSQIVFVSDRSGNLDLWLMNAAGEITP